MGDELGPKEEGEEEVGEFPHELPHGVVVIPKHLPVGLGRNLHRIYTCWHFISKLKYHRIFHHPFYYSVFSTIGHVIVTIINCIISLHIVSLVSEYNRKKIAGQSNPP